MATRYFLSTTDMQGKTLYWSGHSTKWIYEFTQAKLYEFEHTARGVRSKIGKCNINSIVDSENLPSKEVVPYWISRLQLDLKNAILDSSKTPQLLLALKHFYVNQSFHSLDEMVRATMGLIAALAWDWKHNGYSVSHIPPLKVDTTKQYFVNCDCFTTLYPSVSFAVDIAKSTQDYVMTAGDYTLKLSLRQEFQDALGCEFYPIEVPIILRSKEVNFPIWLTSLFTQTLSGGNIARVDHLLNWCMPNDHKTQYKLLHDLLNQSQFITFKSSTFCRDVHFNHGANTKLSVPRVVKVHEFHLSIFRCPISGFRFSIPLIEVWNKDRWVSLLKLINWECEVYANFSVASNHLPFNSAYQYVIFGQPLPIVA